MRNSPQAQAAVDVVVDAAVVLVLAVALQPAAARRQLAVVVHAVADPVESRYSSRKNGKLRRRSNRSRRNR